MSKLLIIDSDHTERNKLASTLKMEAENILSTDTGADALQIAKREVPDLILTDATLPEIDSGELLKSLRSDATTADIPVIVLGAKVAGTEGTTSLAKPFEIPDLLKAVRSSLERRFQSKRALYKKQRIEQDTIAAVVPVNCRAPLERMVAAAEMLHEGLEFMTPEIMKEMLGLILDSGYRLGHIIDNLTCYLHLSNLSPARIAKYRSSVTKVTTEFLLENLRIHFDPQERARIEVECAEMSLPMDPDHFWRVAYELLENSLKFSPRGAPVKLRGSLGEKTYLLEVTDSGAGMSQEQVKNIGPFMQFEPSEEQSDGIGLGLAIVRKIVEFYGARFYVESTPYGGTRVIVRFHL